MLAIIAAFLTIFILIKTIEPVHVIPAVWYFTDNKINTIHMTAFRQDHTLTGFDSPRDTGDRISAYLDRITFGNQEDPKDSVFSKFGLYRNFFADFTTLFSLQEQHEVTFSVHSDDGFRLLVDDKEMAGFFIDRVYEETQVKVSIAPGDHTLLLQYFQGEGFVGLDAFYRIADNDEWHPVGESTPYLMFMDFNNE